MSFCARTQKISSSLFFLCLCANNPAFEDLFIQNHYKEFLRTYAKNFHVSIKNLRICANNPVLEDFGVIPNPKMAFIFPISCILALIFPILIKYFPKCVGKGSFPKSQIKSLTDEKPYLYIRDQFSTWTAMFTGLHVYVSFESCLIVDQRNIFLL